ncbi:MAG: RICIN domain-containing protein [Candidatus Schekmanbacteria bacterium]|nr:RICIN domain-containing protein [Candidatus Schekmanbacteria bacterium]
MRLTVTRCHRRPPLLSPALIAAACWLVAAPAATGASAQDRSFTVVAYNSYLKVPPVDGPNSEWRANNMALALRRATGAPDVIVVSEAFDDTWAGERGFGPGYYDGYSQCLEDRMCILKRRLWMDGYSYITENVGTEGGALQDGGVFIASRWPIEVFRKMIYTDSVGSDYHADKGAAYARVNKNGRYYHVFATHTQATYFYEDGSHQPDSPEYAQVRELQFRELATFIRAQDPDRGEPIFIAGDLNVDRDSPEFARMLSLLGAGAPPASSRTAGGRMFTFDSANNTLKGGGEFDYEPDAWYDHVLVIDNEAHLRGENIAVEVEAVSQDLSDHHAVIGRFVPIREDVPAELVISPALDTAACLDVAGASSAAHARLQTFSCHFGANQRFRLRRVSNATWPHFEILPATAGMCLDAPTGASYVQQYPCHGGLNQQWQLVPISGQMAIRNAASGTYLGASGSGQVTQTTSLSQAFFLVRTWRVDPNLLLKNSRNEADCMDVPSSSLAAAWVNGAYPCNRGSNQQWSLEELYVATGSGSAAHTGEFVVRARHSGMCLDIPATSGAQRYVRQQTCGYGSNQRFAVQMQLDGSFTLRNVGSLLCLGLPDSGFPWLVARECGAPLAIGTRTPVFWKLAP